MALTVEQRNQAKESLRKLLDDYFNGSAFNLLSALIDTNYELAMTGTGTSIPIEFIFVSETLRDNFFQARTNLLEQNETAIIVNDGTDYILQIWTGADSPPSYDNSNWDTVSTLSLTQAEKQHLEDLTGITTAVIPIKTADGFEDSSVSETTERVEFAKPLFAPEIFTDSSSIITGPTRSSSNTKSQEIQDLVNGQRAIQLQTRYDDNGTTTPYTPVLSSTVVKDISILEDITLPQSIEFSYGITTNRHSNQVILKAAEAGNINIVVRFNNAMGRELYRVRNFEITQQQVDNNEQIIISADNGGQAVVLIGDTVHFTIDGVSLKGHTYSGDATFGDQSIPYLRIGAHEYSETNLATEDFVRNLIGSRISLHGFSINIPNRVDLNTNLNVEHTVTFSVTDFSQITQLELLSGNTVVATLTNPTSDGVQTQLVTPTGLTTDTAKTIQLRLRANNDNSLLSNSQNIQVRVPIQSEIIYYGVGDIDPATVDLSTLQTQAVTVPGQFNIELTPQNDGDDIVIIYPNTKAVTEILNRSFSNINVIDSFTLLSNVRDVSGTMYSARELDNLNSGLTFRYTIKHN